jgi:Arc/MetJ family transcription regulator
MVCIIEALDYTSGDIMRTNIVIDDELMAEALRATGLRTKREAVEAGLRLLARRARQAAAADLLGTVDWRGDLDAERRDNEQPQPGRRDVAAE